MAEVLNEYMEHIYEPGCLRIPAQEQPGKTRFFACVICCFRIFSQLACRRQEVWNGCHAEYIWND